MERAFVLEKQIEAKRIEEISVKVAKAIVEERRSWWFLKLFLDEEKEKARLAKLIGELTMREQLVLRAERVQNHYSLYLFLAETL